MIQKHTKKHDTEIGFGSRVGDKGNRILNEDGDFNFKRKGTSFDLFQYLVTCSLSKFLWFVFLYYILVNALFALLYNIIGIDHLEGIEITSFPENFVRAFFFSVQTFTTVGYGVVHPVGLGANALSSVEALIGILSVSVVSGVLFTRFNRARNPLAFSKHAIINEQKGIPIFHFRIANRRRSEVIEAKARVIFSIFKEVDGVRKRVYHNMKLHIDSILFFPLNWTIAHNIDEDSPLYGYTAEELKENYAEVLVLVSGYDDVSMETIHAKYSYTVHDFMWNKKFFNAYSENARGETVFDIRDLGKLVD